jgi:7-carboxy-7-deazaguanine synthase (Cx14CxxC type)
MPVDGKAIYQVKEIFFTLQGEGAQVGRPAVFLRFTGCNLWNGLERDRATAMCQFCDTDFIGIDGPGGGRFGSPEEVAEAVRGKWPESASGRPYVVCTGGEPALQLDEKLVCALHEAGFEIGVETNGTLPLPPGIDWICVSPKGGTELVQRKGDELKLVYPQPFEIPESFEDLDFRHFSLQPMDGPDRERNTKAAVEYCLANPKWRLSVQTHKFIGIP